ncbi:hypothetical protein F4778DRAFT_635197 [Xylariomycetidae sp. FL2044]|nr:hypothetical protein F4778DRAFT_635197 [Xylariomycetidae sp. FL2044]
MSSIQANTNPPSLPPSTPSDSSPSSRSRPEKDDISVPNPTETDSPDDASGLLLNAVKDVRQIIRLVQCSICSGLLQEPTTLPCGRSICRRCLPETYDRTNISWPGTASRLHGFQCPFVDCEKEHAIGDCAIDVTLNKVLAIIKTAIELDRDVTGLSHVSTQVTTQDAWEIAGLSSLDERSTESQVLKGGRIVATYTLAELGKLRYNLEVSYVAVGVGDEEVEAIDVAVLARLKESARTEMDCQVCYALLLDPFTTTCGHTFCRTCIQRTLDHSNLCPICRREMEVKAELDSGTYPSNERLCKIINGFWADLVQLRAQSQRLEQQANYGGFDIPLFVCTLSFPRMPTFLHVFEPRYRLMIRRAMESSRTFGMVLAQPRAPPGTRSFTEYGTLLRIVNIHFFEDGRSILETVGVSRFRVIRDGMLDGYLVGNVEKVDDISTAEEEAAEAAETRRAQGIQPFVAADQQLGTASPGRSAAPITLDDLDTKSTRQLLEIGIEFVQRTRLQSAAWLTARALAIYGDCPSDPAIFPWWLASILPIKDDEKYRLLSTTSVRERLKICCRWIVEWESRS